MPKPKVIFAWTESTMEPPSVQEMGVQKNPDGTGYRRLEAGDEPRHCHYCNTVVTEYPHEHTKRDWERFYGA